MANGKISPSGDTLYLTDTLNNRVRAITLAATGSGGVPATGAAYTLSGSDVGALVRVAVTATNPDGSATAYSTPTTLINAAPPTNSQAPTLTGSIHRDQQLSANPGSWGGADNAYTYQWQRSANGTTWTDISGANTAAYTITTADELDGLRVLVTAANPDGTLAVASTATTTVPSEPPTNSVAPTVTGTAQRTMTLTGTPGTWGGLGNTYTYQWQSSTNGSTWTSISGATTLTYTVAQVDEGAKLRLLVTATNPDGTLAVASTPTATVVAAPPTNSQIPSITGTAQRTGTLTLTSNGTWAGIGNTYAYQWQRSTDGATWTTITGATATSYTVAKTDENAKLRLLVTATNPDATLAVATATTSTVTANPPKLTTSVQISGSAVRAGTVTLTDQGTWSGPDNTYAQQWQRSTDGTTWVAISGATGQSYKLTKTDENAYIRTLITATNPDAAVSASSAPSGPVSAAAPHNSTLPAISGTLQRGQTLTGTQGTWDGPDNTYTQQWQRSADGQSWTSIDGATDLTYTIQGADINDHLRLVVTATNMDAPSGVPAASVASAIVLSNPPQNTTRPSVSGTARLAATMSAIPGVWTPAGASFAYQWQRSATGGYTDIAGATASTYSPAAADLGHTLRVNVTASNPDGSVSAASDATSAVIGPPKNLTAPAAPSGTLQDASTLTADPGTWDTPGVSFAFQWLRCPATATDTTNCTPLGTAATYTLATADVGARIAVTVAATSTGGTSDPAASALSAVVKARTLQNTVPPSISGAAQVPGTLTANPGTWNLPTTSVSYAWQRCNADGTSGCAQAATGQSYPLTSADANHAIVLYATATGAAGQSATAHSPALTISAQPLPQVTVAPNVTGTAQRTYTLTAAPGTWTNNPTLAGVWQRCNTSGQGCADVPGATGLTYTLTKADEGATFTYKVTATNTAGSTIAAAQPSAVVAANLPVATHSPVLTGISYMQDVQVGIVPGSAIWQASTDTTYATSWQRCDQNARNCATLAGQTGGLYTPTGADVGHTLVAVVTATNPDGSVPASSNPTPVITVPAPRWKALPLISVDPGRIGDTLTVTPGVWTGPEVDSDVVRMMRCTSSCAPAGAVGPTSYTIADADLGAVLRVQEVASNAGGATAVWSARYVGPVISAAAGTSVLKPSATIAVKNTNGAALAVASLHTQTASGERAMLARAAAVKRPASRTVRTATVKRAKGITGTLSTWVCEVPPAGSTSAMKCTAKTRIRQATTVKLPASMTAGKLRVVVVRR